MAHFSTEDEAMKNGPCPKCGSKEIYAHRTSTRNNLQLGLFREVHLRKYICTDCGFIETYLDDMKDTSKIIDKCEKA